MIFSDFRAFQVDPECFRMIPERYKPFSERFGDASRSTIVVIGVRQGSNSGPVLFLYIMQAAMETMEWPVAEPQFCTAKKGEPA